MKGGLEKKREEEEFCLFHMFFSQYLSQFKEGELGPKLII